METEFKYLHIHTNTQLCDQYFKNEGGLQVETHTHPQVGGVGWKGLVVLGLSEKIQPSVLNPLLKQNTFWDVTRRCS